MKTLQTLRHLEDRTYLGLYKHNPDLLAVMMMQNPKHLRGAMEAFTGGENEGGFNLLQDAVEVIPGTQVTADGQPLSEIWQDLLAKLAAFNTQMSFMVSLLSFPINRATERVAIYQTPRFERATELGRPGKVRLQYVTRGYPLNHEDLAFGYTQEFIDSARGSEIRSITAQAENAWWNLNQEVVLEAVFFEDNNTDVNGVVVKRLYNGDGEIPPTYKRVAHAGTHTHYLTTAGAAIVAADLDVIEEHLVHHGYGDFGERFILHVNRVDLPVVRGFANFVPASTATIPTIVNGEVVGQQRVGIPGLATEGYHGKLVITENSDIPAGYVFCHATGGQFASQNVAGLRQHENPSIRGMRLVEGPIARYPLIDAVYDGYLGSGVRHRGGGVVMEITAGSYTDPTF